MASLPPSEIAYQEAHINDNLSTTLIVVSTVFTALGLLSLLARLIARRLARAHLGWDDYLAIAAMVNFYGQQNLMALAADHSKPDTNDRFEYRGVPQYVDVLPPF